MEELVPVKYCPECGSPVSETGKFCANCGFRLVAPEATVPDSPPEQVPLVDPQAAAPPEPPKKDVSGLPPAWMPMPVQPGSGTIIEQNPAGSESAATTSGGTSSGGAKDLSGLPPAWMPPPVKPTFGESEEDRSGGLSAVDDDWKMSDLGPPPPQKRRLWIWIPLFVIAAVIVCCITFIILSETVLEDTFDNWATQIATDSTEESISD